MIVFGFSSLGQRRDRGLGVLNQMTRFDSARI